MYEALPYYQRIPDFPAVADQKLQRRCYLILGVWQTADGQQTAIFRADGTCSIFGQTLYFAVDGYALKTGAAADALTLTHKLTVLNKDSLTLRVLTDGKNTVYQLRHLSDETMVCIQRPEYGGGEIWLDDELVRKDGLFLPEELRCLNPDALR